MCEFVYDDHEPLPNEIWTIKRKIGDVEFFERLFDVDSDNVVGHQHSLYYKIVNGEKQLISIGCYNTKTGIQKIIHKFKQ
jgi:hypothetical protein